MRADRLLRLLALLQRHRHLPAATLARELEVSERTVLRDMEALSAAGVPVYTERGRGGGCALLDGFTTQASGLTPGEAQALFAWTSRESVAELGLGAELAGALAKVSATAPTVAVERAEALGDVVHADRRRWYAAREEVPFLPVLRDAAQRRVRVRVRYRSAEQASATQRTLDPVGLVDQSGRWYLVAEHRGTGHTYRVSRFEDVVALREPARLRDDRPLAEIWADLRRGFERDEATTELVLHVEPGHGGIARRVLTMQLAPGTEIRVCPQPAPDGRERWELTLRRLDVLGSVAVWLAPHVTVVEPVWLRERILERARAALQHYG